MSTKIYDAYEVKISTNELLSKLTELQNEWKNELTHYVAIDIISKIFEDIINSDKVKITKKVFHRKLREYYAVFKTDLHNFKDYAFIDFEGKYFDNHELKKYDSSVVLYQYNNQNFLQLFGSEKFKKFTLSFFSNDLVDFHYQNQVEADKDTEKQYEKRKKIWEEIFKETYVPGEVGLVIDFTGIPSLADIFKASKEKEVIEKIQEGILPAIKWATVDKEWGRLVKNGDVENTFKAFDEFVENNRQRLSEEAEKQYDRNCLIRVLDKSNGTSIVKAPQSYCVKEVEEYLYLKTYQSAFVADTLSQTDYFASMKNARFPKEYWYLKNLLKIKAHPKFECPVFCCHEDLEECNYLGYSSDECLIHLKVPVAECIMMEFYDWTDVMSSIQEHDEYLEVGSKKIVEEVNNKMDVHAYEQLQVVLTCIKKEWVQNIERERINYV